MVTPSSRPVRNPDRPRYPHAFVLRYARIIEQRALEPSSQSSMASAVRCFERECHRWGIAPWPVSYHNFGAYIAWYCHTGGCARSIKTIKSHLHHYSKTNGLPWLSREDDFHISKLQTAFLKIAPKPVRAKPATFDTLLALYRAANKTSLPHLQLLAMSTLAHDCLLRPGELCSLTVADVDWVTADRTALDLVIQEDKTNKVDEPEVLFTQAYPAPEDLCAVVVLSHYLDCVEAIIGVSPLSLPSTTPLFPADWRQPTKALPQAAFVSQLRALLFQAGFTNAASYSGHSFRSGGCSDLFYAECREWLIGRLGRWRDPRTYKQHYIRDRSAAMRAEVAAAFARAAAASQRASNAQRAPSP